MRIEDVAVGREYGVSIRRDQLTRHAGHEILDAEDQPDAWVIPDGYLVRANVLDAGLPYGDTGSPVGVRIEVEVVISRSDGLEVRTIPVAEAVIPAEQVGAPWPDELAGDFLAWERELHL
jgi:hypothetical protein